MLYKELATEDESGLVYGMEDMMELKCTNRHDLQAIRTKWQTLMSCLGPPFNANTPQPEATKRTLVYAQIEGSKLLERELVRYELEETLPDGTPCKSLSYL